MLTVENLTGQSSFGFDPPMARIVVVGAGVAGLGTALGLGRAGHEVTILERDATPLPADPHAAFAWDRRGAGTRAGGFERRRSDFIENIHDGSILDHLTGTSGEQIKLVYTSMMGVALLTFTITGFWLWIGPRRMRSMSRDIR